LKRAEARVLELEQELQTTYAIKSGTAAYFEERLEKLKNWEAKE
jgi:hypothetical protein